MSYCRWSSDGFQCDVYCYEHVDDYFVIHVAGSRRVSKIPNPGDGDILNDDIDVFMKKHQAVMDWVNNADLAPIGLPHDGETFCEPTAQLAADRLIELRRIGYRVPQYAIDRLLEEANESKGMDNAESVQGTNEGQDQTED